MSLRVSMPHSETPCTRIPRRAGPDFH